MTETMNAWDLIVAILKELNRQNAEWNVTQQQYNLIVTASAAIVDAVRDRPAVHTLRTGVAHG